MTLYGGLTSGLTALCILGAGAAYVADIGAGALAAAETVSAEISCYVLRAYNGSVALFKDGEDEPVEVYSTLLEEINPADAAQLAEGISEVNRLLEDLEIY